MKKLTDKEREIYWMGFEDGKMNSIKHNINLLKLQLNKKKEKKIIIHGKQN